MRHLRLIFIAPIFAMIALVVWAVSSPVGSSPDDDYHLNSIWCGQGIRAGLCEAVPGHHDERALPSGVAEALCNPMFPQQAKRCAVEAKQHTPMIATDRGNFEGTYPPVYYAFMSVFASSHYALSAIAMRVINALLFIGITTLLYFLLSPARRRTLVWMWAIAVVPLAAFLLASDNPSAWAIISGGTLWMALLGYFESRAWRSAAFAIIAVLVTVMGAGARADAAIYAVISVGIALVLAVRRSREFWLKSILPVGIVIVAALLYMASRQSGVASSGLTGSHAASATSSSSLIWNNLLEVPSLWVGSLGTWGLGWLDTPMPAVVFVSCIAVFGAATFTGLVSHSARKLIALLVAFAALVAIPSWVLLRSQATVGQEVQPRYILPLLVVFGGLALLEGSSRRIVFSRLQVAAAALVVSVANAVALHVNIRRYVSGLSVSGWDLNHHVRWWWHIPISPMALWVVGSVAFAVAVAIALWEVSVRPRVRDASGLTTPSAGEVS